MRKHVSVQQKSVTQVVRTVAKVDHRAKLCTKSNRAEQRVAQTEVGGMYCSGVPMGDQRTNAPARL